VHHKQYTSVLVGQCQELEISSQIPEANPSNVITLLKRVIQNKCLKIMDGGNSAISHHVSKQKKF